MQNKDRFLTLHYCKLLTSANKRSVANGEDRISACREIKDFERAFIKKLQKLDIPAFCSSMLRTQEEQIQLYVTGQSPDMPGHSAHEIGQACDIYHADYGPSLPTKCWEILGHIGEEIAVSQGTGVLWGGIIRPHHWEIL